MFKQLTLTRKKEMRIGDGHTAVVSEKKLREKEKRQQEELQLNKIDLKRKKKNKIKKK